MRNREPRSNSRYLPFANPTDGLVAIRRGYVLLTALASPFARSRGWARVNILRVIGWLLLLAALILLGVDFHGWITSGHWKATLAGDLWHRLSPNSLALLQPAIERHIWPPLWHHAVLPVLIQPAWLDLGVLGLILVVIPRRSRKRRRFGR